MAILDIALLIIIAGFVFYGLFFGLIRTVGSLLGLIIGLWLATLLYEPVFAMLHNLAFGFDSIGRSIAFFILFTIINRLVVLLFALLDRTFDFFSIIPFLKTINRLAGAVFGLIESGFLLGFIWYIIQSYPVLAAFIDKFDTGSKIMPYLIRFVEILRPIFPNLLDKLKELT